MFVTSQPAIPPQDYYVYEHRKATTGEVFYVGKGRDRRAWAHGLAKRSAHWMRVAIKHGVAVHIVIDGLQDWAAQEIEKDRIALHGRLSDGKGLLINMTDGGDGTAGSIPSEETRAKRSASVSAAFSRPESKQRLAAATSTEDFRRRKRESQIRSWTDERKRIASERMRKRWESGQIKSHSKGTTKPGIQVECVETGTVFESMNEAVRWLACNGYPKAQSSPISLCCQGKRLNGKSYGLSWRFVEEKSPE